MADAHSLFSASGAEGWMICHGKPVMEKGRYSSSEYAAEGTAAHTLAQWVLDNRLAVKADATLCTARGFIGRVITVVDGSDKRLFTVDATMAEHVDDYVDAFMSMSAMYGGRVLRFAEQRVAYGRFLDQPDKLAFGTCDAPAICMDAPALDWEDEDGETHHFPAGVELQVHDLKYGVGVRVFAVKLAQGRMYALGALNDFELVADITRVRIVIHQPRLDHVSEEVISVAELLAWAELPKAAAPKVRKLVDTITPPAHGYQHYRDVPKALAAHLVPSEKGCRFCDGKAVCPALFAEAAEFATAGAKATVDDFADLTVDTPTDVKNYGDNWLAMAADKLDLIDTLRKAIRAEIDNRVLRRGMKVGGFKIVEGAQGDRKWNNEAEAEKRLKAMRLPPAAMYKSKLISPTGAEKLLKKSSPHFASLGDLITRSPGAPSVVRDNDPRPEFSGHRASADDFEDVTETQGADTRHPFR